MAREELKMAHVPDVVSKRNHFESVGTMVDRYWNAVPKDHKAESVRKFLVSYTESVVHMMCSAFETGAQRGIEQTARLMIDPAFYDTLKERRKRQRERFEQQERAQEEERLERRLAPTAAQILEEEDYLRECITDSQDRIERCNERLKYLAKLKNRPKHVRINEARDSKGDAGGAGAE